MNKVKLYLDMKIPNKTTYSAAVALSAFTLTVAANYSGHAGNDFIDGANSSKNIGLVTW